MQVNVDGRCTRIHQRNIGQTKALLGCETRPAVRSAAVRGCRCGGPGPARHHTPHTHQRFPLSISWRGGALLTQLAGPVRVNNYSAESLYSLLVRAAGPAGGRESRAAAAVHPACGDQCRARRGPGTSRLAGLPCLLWFCVKSNVVSGEDARSSFFQISKCC